MQGVKRTFNSQYTYPTNTGMDTLMGRVEFGNDRAFVYACLKNGKTASTKHELDAFLITSSNCVLFFASCFISVYLLRSLPQVLL